MVMDYFLVIQKSTFHLDNKKHVVKTISKIFFACPILLTGPRYLVIIFRIKYSKKLWKSLKGLEKPCLIDKFWNFMEVFQNTISDSSPCPNLEHHFDRNGKKIDMWITPTWIKTLTLFRMKGGKKLAPSSPPLPHHSTSFFVVTFSNFEISYQNFLNFSFNSFALLV